MQICNSQGRSFTDPHINFAQSSRQHWAKSSIDVMLVMKIHTALNDRAALLNMKQLLWQSSMDDQRPKLKI